jgi:hypothetical protein
MFDPHQAFDKHLLRLDRELSDLYRRRHRRFPLAEPIQRGWRRRHVLSPSGERRDDKDVLLTLLMIIGTVKIRRTPEFRKRRGRGTRRSYIEIEQPLRELTVGEWKKRNLPEEWKPYFRQEKRCHFRVWNDALVFADASAFELKVEPNWITEVTILDPAVEKRIAEINAWLRRHDGLHRIDWLHGFSRSHWRWCDPRRQDVLDRIAQRELRLAMANPSEVEPAASARRTRLSFRRSRSMRACATASEKFRRLSRA